MEEDGAIGSRRRRRPMIGDRMAAMVGEEGRAVVCTPLLELCVPLDGANTNRVVRYLYPSLSQLNVFHCITHVFVFCGGIIYYLGF